MDRYYEDFRDYSDGIGSSGFCNFCKGPEFYILSFVCFLLIIALFYVKKIKQKNLRFFTYLSCLLTIFCILYFTKYPALDLIGNGMLTSMALFFLYIALGYIIIGIFNFIRSILSMLKRK